MNAVPKPAAPVTSVEWPRTPSSQYGVKYAEFFPNPFTVTVEIRERTAAAAVARLRAAVVACEVQLATLATLERIEQGGES